MNRNVRTGFPDSEVLLAFPRSKQIEAGARKLLIREWQLQPLFPGCMDIAVTHFCRGGS